MQNDFKYNLIMNTKLSMNSKARYSPIRVPAIQIKKLGHTCKIQKLLGS